VSGRATNGLEPERWERAKDIFVAAIALAGTERESYLNEQCGGDVELRQEVESLLESYQETADFLERPVAFVQPPEEQERTNAGGQPGMRIGAYELVREIGRGGMGAVFLAVRADNEFRKQVAIKLIHRGMESPLAVQRFRNERQILARLEHPNIARLIDGGTTSEGSPYFIMEYVEGTPIREYCRDRGLSGRERLAIYLKVCSAVHYAHRRMIIHRDLKPTNVLVKEDGTPKLLDFGIAKLLGPDTDPTSEGTMPGMLACTPAYASPEQLRGHPATVRSDIYSLGVVLYELITGTRPPVSSMDRAAVPPTMPTDCVELLQRGLREVMARATRQDPDERYDSVETFAADIEKCLGAGARGADISFMQTRGSVAVLPFRVLSLETGDNYLGIGITDAIITKLSNIGRLSVRSSTAVMQYTNATDIQAAGREMSVEFILEGRVQKVESRIRVTVQLVRVQSADTVWAASFDEQFEDLLRVEDSISGQVAMALVPQLTGEEKEHLARGGTASAKAYESYLRGRWHWSKHTEEDRAQALVAFLEAIAEDPRYARAHAGVADYYVQLGIWGGLPPAESFAAAKASAQSSIEIDPELAEAHASLGFALWAHDRDYSAAAHELQLAITLNPDYGNAHLWFGLLNSCRGRHDIALASVERAAKLSPNEPVYASSLAVCYYYARRFDRAISFLGECVAKWPLDGVFHEVLAWTLLAAGKSAAALPEAREAVRLDGGSVLSICVLAHAEAALGNTEAARTLLADLKARNAQRYISSSAIAAVALACGQKSDALDWLERAWRDRDWWVMWIAPGPRWDPLRNDPRFRTLLSKGGLSGYREPAPPSIPAQDDRRPRKAPWRFIAAGAAILLFTAIVFLLARRQPATTPFHQARVTKITTNGLAVNSALSSDGRYLAYSINPGGRLEIWVRDLSTAQQKRIAGPLEGDMRGLQFTRGGSHIAYVSFTRKDPNRGQLYLVPVEGGQPELVKSGVASTFRLSADGTQAAMMRPEAEAGYDELLVSALDGSNQRRVAMQRYPDRIAWDMPPGWSVDGKSLAYSFGTSDARGFYMGVMTVDIAKGTTKTVKSPRWQRIDNITWTAGGDALLVVGQEQESSFSQIWHLPLGRGEPSRVTNDLSDYSGADLTADGTTLVSAQQLNLSNVYKMRQDDGAAPVQLTPGGGRYFDLRWAPDGRIVYASDASGSADIWLMNGNGTGQQQLTPGAGRSYSPVFTPDGRYIIFHSNRVGNWNIWRMDADGKNVVQLTSGNRDSNWPQVTPDSKYAIYHHTGLNAMFNIWRVPVEGGQPVQLTGQLTMHPAVSPRDGSIACWYSEEVATPRWRIAIFPASGGMPSRTFDAPENVTPDTTLSWTPRGDGLTMVDGRNGVSNIWLMPIDGRPGRLLTNFNTGLIYAFDWSPNGDLLFSRGMTSTDVVMIRDEQPQR
jgi:serine/threonine protein kinase/Tol biopolymer transport system component/tetratricopeptide (TPR) repeat protein